MLLPVLLWLIMLSVVHGNYSSVTLDTFLPTDVCFCWLLFQFEQQTVVGFCCWEGMENGCVVLSVAQRREQRNRFLFFPTVNPLLLKLTNRRPAKTANDECLTSLIATMFSPIALYPSMTTIYPSLIAMGTCVWLQLTCLLVGVLSPAEDRAQPVFRFEGSQTILIFDFAVHSDCSEVGLDPGKVSRSGTGTVRNLFVQVICLWRKMRCSLYTHQNSRFIML